MTQRRRFRWFRYLIGTLLVLVLGVFIAVWFVLAGSRAQLDGEVQVNGIGDAVAVTRDALGTTTFQGKSRDDVTYAMGYVHGQERFFAMDLMRRQPAAQACRTSSATRRTCGW